jgi:hypothetical protein
MEFGLGAEVFRKSSATIAAQVDVSAGRSADAADVCPGAEHECAVAVVSELFSRAGLSRMLDPQSLKVTVGKGNWISFSFQMQRGADHSSLDLSKLLRRTSRKPQEGKSRKSAWFRSEGVPSLHFEVVPAERLGEIFVQGHVDAADPKGHSIAHVFRDYLPAHGVGTHPSPKKLLAMLTPHHAG